MNWMKHETRVRLCAALSALMLLALTGTVMCLPEAEIQPTQAVIEPPAQEVYRADRDALREQEKAQLQAILDDPQTGDSMRAQAQQRLMELLEWAGQEAAIEENLALRGYEGVVASVYRDSANVMVCMSELSREQAAVILELVALETGLSGGSIKVIPYK